MATSPPRGSAGSSCSPRGSPATTLISRVSELHGGLKAQLAEHAQAQQATQLLVAKLAASRKKEQSVLASVSSTLSLLRAQRMSLSALQSTQVGVTVARLRKSDHATVSEMSKELVTHWKRLAESGGRGMEGDGSVSRRGKMPRAEDEETKKGRAAELLSQGYQRLEEQKRARQLVQLSASEAAKLKKPRRL